MIAYLGESVFPSIYGHPDVRRARLDPETKAYLARKRSEGKSNREAMRRLERHVARRVWKLLQPAETLDNRPMTIHCNLPRGSFGLT